MMRYPFSLKKADLFSAVTTVLSIFILRQLDIGNVFLFMVLVVLFTIALDFVYKWCK